MLAHNYYSSRSPSGENEVVIAEKNMLIKYGHFIEEFSRSNDEVKFSGLKGNIISALSVPWNFSVVKKARENINRYKPDVVHVHNSFPLISPSIFHAVRSDAATVLTLHNYRLFCAAAVPLKGQEVCTQCLDRRTAIPSLYYGCYRSSRLATFPLALSIGLHRNIGTWDKRVDAYICLTEFQRDLMVKAGLPAHKLHIKPNFYPGNPKVRPWQSRQPYVVFVGRLAAEKGLNNLVEAWRIWGKYAPELRIIGDGPLRQELEEAAIGLPIIFTGLIPRSEVANHVAQAYLQILPSNGFETFGLAVVEAFAHGTPAAVSNIGPLPSIVKNQVNGVVFQAGSPYSLFENLRSAWNTSGRLEKMGQQARIEFEGKYTEEANYKILVSIYEQAILGSQKRAGIK